MNPWTKFRTRKKGFTVMNPWTKFRIRFADLGIHYILQSLLALFTVLIMVLVLGEEKIVAISSVGASAFIIFATPKNAAAQTRNVLVGYLIGFAIGYLFSLATMHYAVGYPLVVGTTILVMLLFNVQHPPAVAAALAVAIGEVSLEGMGAIMMSVIVLSQFRYYMLNYLKNLV